MSTSIGVNMGF